MKDLAQRPTHNNWWLQLFSLTSNAAFPLLKVPSYSSRPSSVLTSMLKLILTKVAQIGLLCFP